MISIRPVLALSIAGALVLSACGDDDDSSDASIFVSPAINVGRTSEPVSQLMAEIYGQGLENAGYRIGRKDPVADQAATMSGLQAGTLHIAPEFTAATLSYLAANGGTQSDATAIDEQMTALREQLPDTLTAFEPANVDDGALVACAAAAIEEFGLTTIGDLADADVTLASTSEFADAAVGGLAALNTAYETELTVTETDDVAAAIADGTAECGVVNALTTSIVLDGLIVLEDDKGFAAANALVPIMTVEAGQADVQAVVDSINASLTTDVVRSLLVKVESGEQSYDLVAKQFLASVAEQGATG